MPFIRRHRPKSSLGDKILAIREGDYKNCFREGEGKHFLGHWKDTGKKNFLHIFSQKLRRACFFTFFLIFFKILKIFDGFAASVRGKA